MLTEVNEAKRYIGARFGYGQPVPDGTYPIPTETSKGKAFMALTAKDGKMGNFKLFWDEELKVSWYDNPMPENLIESKWSKAFRKLESIKPDR